MSDLETLTANHREALERLEVQERARKKHGRTLAVAMVTALGGGAGTAAKAYFDYQTDRAAMVTEAEERATEDEIEAVHWGKASDALEALDEALTGCVERSHELDRRLSKAEVAIDFLTSDQRWIRRSAAERVDRTPLPTPARKRLALPKYGELEPDPERVQQRAAEILEDLED